MGSKIALKDATSQQLRAFAENTLGISLPHNIGEEKMRAKIAEAWGQDEITLEDAPPPALQDGASQASVQVLKPTEPGKVRLILHRSNDAGGDEPIPVGVNGKVMLIPRGEEVSIPAPYFEVLKNAVSHMYETDREGSLVYPPREVQMYPFQRMA